MNTITYEIKDKKLAKAIADYIALLEDTNKEQIYSWYYHDDTITVTATTQVLNAIWGQYMMLEICREYK